MCGVGSLKRYCCTNGIRCFGELGNQGITSNLARGSFMARDDLGESPESALNTFVREGFVELDERGLNLPRRRVAGPLAYGTDPLPYGIALLRFGAFRGCYSRDL